MGGEGQRQVARSPSGNPEAECARAWVCAVAQAGGGSPEGLAEKRWGAGAEVAAAEAQARAAVTHSDSNRPGRGDRHRA